MVSSWVLGSVGKTEAHSCCLPLDYQLQLWDSVFALNCSVWVFYSITPSSSVQEYADALNLILAEICPFSPNEKGKYLKGNEIHSGTH